MPLQYAPHPYQLKAIQLMCANPSACLFLDPGMGKTSSALAAFDVLRDHGAAQAMLVVAPIRPMTLTWPNEVAKWADFAHLRVSVIHGSPAKREAAMRKEADIYLINPENLQWLAGLRNKESRWGIQPNVLVVDESTKFKNARSQRFGALESLLPAFDRRYILTGTPAPQSVEDLFGQVKLVDDGARLGRYITHFRRQFCWAEEVRIGGGRTITKWHAKDDAADRVFAKLGDIALRLQAEDYLSMPTISYNTIEVPMPGAVKVAYDRMAEELFAKTASGATLTAPTAAAAVMKLRQISNGVAYDEEGSGVMLHDAKIDALRDLVEEQSGQPLLVAVAFLGEVRAIRDALGQDIPYLGGGVSRGAADDIVARWNQGRIPVLLAHPTSVAHGLNLQAGGHAVCWFGLTWNLEEYLQFNARVYRQGQDKPVMIHHIACGAIDLRIADALVAKGDVQSAILNQLKEKSK